MVVKQQLDALQLPYDNVQLGEADLKNNPTDEEMAALSHSLEEAGFAIIDNRKSRLIEQIKKEVIQHIHHNNTDTRYNFSEHVSQQLHYDYKYLSTLFSEVEGTTIEQYTIAQKIEKVKELLVYDKLTLSEIADRLGYSSVAHLSNQFKKVTGLTPSHFKKIRDNKRRPIDSL